MNQQFMWLVKLYYLPKALYYPPINIYLKAQKHNLKGNVI